jgi:hypothetical protein
MSVKGNWADSNLCIACSRHADDIFEGNGSEMLHRQNSLKVDAGGTGAAAFEGAKTVANSRPKGRKGMEGLLVRQDKCFVNMLQDFYVACLKVLMFLLHWSTFESVFFLLIIISFLLEKLMQNPLDSLAF